MLEKTQFAGNKLLFFKPTLYTYTLTVINFSYKPLHKILKLAC